jgi:TrmH family RNA methyltransferase
LKDVRRAISRGALTEQGWCVAETPHLLEEALRSQCEVKAVLASESALGTASAPVRRLPVKLVSLPDALFAGIAGTETSQGVIALVEPPEWKLEQLFSNPPALVVVLDGLQDPGNAGTIVRAAEAFGATGIFFLKGSVSPYNPKTLRASAGSLFRVPFLHGVDAAAACAALAKHGVELFAGVPAGVSSRPLASVDLTASCGLVIGNEARGVSRGLRDAARDVSIPTVGVESLNAAMAAAILLYEARRQRMPRV